MAELPPKPPSGVGSPEPPATFTFTLGPPPEVLDYLKAKKLTPSFDYRDVWGEEHVGGFTVAKATTLDVLSTFHEAVIKSEAEGVAWGAFKRDLQPALEKLGWWGIREQTDPKTGEKRPVQLGSPHRLRVIYRTNLATAHSAARWQRIERTQTSFPYLEYRLGPSVHHRPQHAAWAGTVLPVTDPFWQTHFTPNGWGCKCWVRQLSKADLGGREPDPSPEIKYRAWKNTRTGETLQVPVGIDPGWDYNPGMARMERMRAAVTQKLNTAPASLAAPIARALVESQAFLRWLAKPKGDYPVAVLDEELARLVQAKRQTVLLSAETMDKQRESHPDLQPHEYQLIPEAIERGEVIAQGEDRLVFLHREQRLYKAVVKATQDREELFLISLQRADERERQRMLRKGEGKVLRKEKLKE
jgi:hypothetical protein